MIIESILASSILVAGMQAGSLELSSLDGNNGFVINGILTESMSGGSVSSVGDVNGDGFDDIIIGAADGAPNGNISAGQSYVVFGSAHSFAESLELASLDGSNGFVINGITANDTSGDAVSSAGDLNGDGFEDILIGAQSADPNGNNAAGESYVVFGSDQGFAASLELSSLDGSNGFVINGIDAGDRSGMYVSSAGDVNDDGFDDIIIGAQWADPNGKLSAGESYVVFGSDQAFTASLELSSLNGINGFVINGITSRDNSGGAVSSAGDVNGDGIDDIFIGAASAGPNGDVAGESYVVFGSDQGFSSSLELSSLDGNNGFVINGIDAGDASGSSVSSAGDVNGDGFDDIIIGAKGADPNGMDRAGESYVVFGSDQFDASLELSSLDGSSGFVLNGIGALDFSSESVSSAGDVNHDGFDDIIIGAPGATADGINNVGESYVVFGTNQEFDSSLELSSLDGISGLVINGIHQGDLSGFSVSSAGDVNGDGFDDILIGAQLGDPNGKFNAGESYVVFFRSSTIVTASAGQETFIISGPITENTYIFPEGSSTASATDRILGIDSDDTIDLSALGLSPEDLEFRIVGGGSDLKIIEGFGPNDFQLRVELNGLTSDDIRSLIIFGDPVDPTDPGSIAASSQQETLIATPAADTFVFGAGTSTLSTIDEIRGIASDDTIDLSALGLSPDDIETRIVAGGTVLKLIEGFGANDFQLRVVLNGLTQEEVISLINFGDGTDPTGPTNPPGSGSSIVATTQQENLIATTAADTFVFAQGTSTLSTIDEIRGIASNDTIDLSALGLSPDDIEYRVVRNGTVLKIIEGFGANDFQLRVVLNGLTQDQIIELIKFDGNSSGPGNSDVVITATTSEEIFAATDEAETFVFANGTSVSAALDTIIGLRVNDTIDLTALGLSPNQVEFRTVGGGSVLKIIDGFGANDFQLKVNLGSLSVAQVMALIDWGSAEATRVLLFSETRDFRHDSTEVALVALEQLAASTGFETDRANDSAGVFTEANLANYDAVVWVLTSGDVLNANEQTAFEQYIRSGGGYAGIHAASFTEYDWPWYGELVGAYFEAHPVIQSATQLVEDTTHSSTAHLDATWTRTDEWYDYSSNPRAQVNVLLSLDESSYTGGTMGDDHPSAWYHEFDGGRSWYTGGGHTGASYAAPDFRAHLLGGLRYVTGRD